MKAIELYKFIHDNNVEFHWRDNEGTKDVIIFPYTFWMDEFSKLIKGCDFDGQGIECRLMDGYFAIWMKDICEYFGIELEEIFGEYKPD